MATPSGLNTGIERKLFDFNQNDPAGGRALTPTELRGRCYLFCTAWLMCGCPKNTKEEFLQTVIPVVDRFANNDISYDISVPARTIPHQLIGDAIGAVVYKLYDTKIGHAVATTDIVSDSENPGNLCCYYFDPNLGVTRLSAPIGQFERQSEIRKLIRRQQENSARVLGMAENFEVRFIKDKCCQLITRYYELDQIRMHAERTTQAAGGIPTVSLPEPSDSNYNPRSPTPLPWRAAYIARHQQDIASSSPPVTQLPENNTEPKKHHKKKDDDGDLLERILDVVPY